MNQDALTGTDPASFRDPSGFVFRDAEGRLSRQVNECYLPSYRRLMESGLYHELTETGLLVEHTAAEDVPGQPVLLFPREIPFVSYPYEWSFSMLRDAALLTLQVQLRAMARGISLKDASAYNVQFDGARPVFIDTLSFEPLKPGAPWVAYGQFCRHFLAPLALMSRTDIRLQRLLAAFIDGVPLDLAVRLLPWRATLQSGIFLHLRLHSKAAARHQATDTAAGQPASLSAKALERVVLHLERTVRKQRWGPRGTEWVDYYQDNSYSEAMRDAKGRWVRVVLQRLRPRTVWDLGANTGLYSRVAREAGAFVVSIDGDPACVERNYPATPGGGRDWSGVSGETGGAVHGFASAASRRPDSASAQGGRAGRMIAGDWGVARSGQRQVGRARRGTFGVTGRRGCRFATPRCSAGRIGARLTGLVRPPTDGGRRPLR